MRTGPGRIAYPGMRHHLVLLVGAALLVSACGAPAAGDPTAEPPTTAAAEPGVFPLVASSDLAVGQQRLLVALFDERSELLGSPTVPVRFELRSPAGSTTNVEAAFLWSIPEERGLYRATVEFDRAGTWTVVAHPEGLPVSQPADFEVKEDPATVAAGEPAPPSKTPTADQAPLDELTTDPQPDPRFYELSIGEAVASGRPTVVVFATPAFCTSKVCGPTLDLVKQAAPSFPGVNFVHVEVYDLEKTPEELVPVPAVVEWGLPSEPWVFVVDDQGRVAARFEGTLASEELSGALGSAGS